VKEKKKKEGTWRKKHAGRNVKAKTRGKERADKIRRKEQEGRDAKECMRRK
jgi:hypothetical protein